MNRVGVLGGGQLGRMLGLAGIPLGLRFHFLEPAPDPPAGEVGEVIALPYDSPRGLDSLAASADLVTYEFENVPAGASLGLLERGVPVYPPPAALEMAQDRLAEKEGFTSLGIPTVPFRPVDSLEGLRMGVEALGLPAVLKTRRLGYDGKGQRVMRVPAEVKPAWEELGARGGLILEGFVSFRRELSLLAVRGRDGAVEAYPLVENSHRDGILVLSRAPAPEVPSALQARALEYARRLLQRLDYVGVLALELFQVGDELLANEIAPRVHNSGHWTQDGAETSQFENHLRAVCGLPLGSTKPRGYSAMVNLLGSLPELPPLLRLPGVHLHLYGKSPRPGRKLGHLNVTGETPGELASRLASLAPLLPGLGLPPGEWAGEAPPPTPPAGAAGHL